MATIDVSESPERVFISSSVIGMEEYRESAKEAILHCGMYPLAMEHDSATATDAVTYSLGLADQADVYVGIFAHRYGEIVPEYDASISELEYRRAVERKLPIFVFIMHDDQPVLIRHIDRDPAKMVKLDRFKRQLRHDQVAGFFKSPENLERQVYEALSKYRLSILQRQAAEQRPGPTSSPQTVRAGKDIPTVMGRGVAESTVTSREETRARAIAKHLVRRVSFSAELTFQQPRDEVVEDVLHELAAASEKREALLCVGQNGSLIDVLEDVLADRIGSGIPFTGNQAPLNSYADLFAVDIRELLAWSGLSGEPDLSLLFDAAVELAASSRALLIVDHIEAIHGQGATAETLKAYFVTRKRALMGLYHAVDAGDFVRSSTLEVPGAVVRQVQRYSREETRVFIERFYAPAWRTRGYAFTPDAFDGVFALEAGAWLYMRPTMLPGLAVELAKHTIVTAAEGEAFVRETAQGALRALAELRRDARADPRTREPFDAILLQAQQDIEQLLHRHGPSSARPTIVARLFGRGGMNAPRLVTLSSAHVMAQFLCPNETQFLFPGEAPRGVRTA